MEWAVGQINEEFIWREMGHPSLPFWAKASEGGGAFQRIKLVEKLGHSPKPQKMKENANKFVVNLCGQICQSLNPSSSTEWLAKIHNPKSQYTSMICAQFFLSILPPLPSILLSLIFGSFSWPNFLSQIRLKIEKNPPMISFI